MGHVSTFYRRAEDAPTAWPELSVVALARPLETETGDVLPVGSQGTIVGTWAAGEAYEVEFLEPFQALETIEAADLHLVERWAR